MISISSDERHCLFFWLLPGNKSVSTPKPEVVTRLALGQWHTSWCNVPRCDLSLWASVYAGHCHTNTCTDAALRGLTCHYIYCKLLSFFFKLFSWILEIMLLDKLNHLWFYFRIIRGCHKIFFLYKKEGIGPSKFKNHHAMGQGTWTVLWSLL